MKVTRYPIINFIIIVNRKREIINTTTYLNTSQNSSESYFVYTL